MGGGGDRHGDGVGHGRVGRDARRGGRAGGVSAKPRRRCQERPALGGGLEVALLRRLEGGGQLDDSRSAAGSRSRGAIGVGEEDGVAPAGTMAQDIAEPGVKGRRIGYAAVLDRPLEAMAVAVGADRKRRRQPGEQALKGGAGNSFCAGNAEVIVDPAPRPSPQKRVWAPSGAFCVFDGSFMGGA